MRERLKVLMEENERISVELANAMAGNVLVRDTIRDSVQVVSAPVVVVGSKSYKKEVADKELLKDLGLKPPQVEEQQTTVTVIDASLLGTRLRLHHRPSRLQTQVSVVEMGNERV